MGKKIKQKKTKDVKIESTVDDEQELKKSKYYTPSQKEKDRLLAIKKRTAVMEAKKKEFDINDRCDSMDLLYKPHLTNMHSEYDRENIDFDERRLITDLTEGEDTYKSIPLAFKKVTTAQAKLIRENIKVTAKAYRSKYKNLNLLAIKAYEENWKALRLIRALRKIVRDAALYSVGYGRRYLKRVWRSLHIEDGVNKNGTTKYKMQREILVDEITLERKDPRDILLDDSCTGPHDAKDCAIDEYYDQADFDARFPISLFPNAQYVKIGKERDIFEKDGSTEIRQKKTTGKQKNKILVRTYEDLLGDTKEIIATGVYLDREPLPGHVLSVVGMKWIDDKEDYDGIGIGQILIIYQPLVDDVLNANNERLRLMVRPVQIQSEDVEMDDDSDEYYGVAAKIKIKGDIGQIDWDRPPAMTDSERAQVTDLMLEIDQMTGISKALEGFDESDTAFQAAQNREEALSVLTIPLDNIKQMLDDDANKAFKLFKEVYSVPEDVKELRPGDEDYENALKLAKDDEDLDENQARAVIMEETTADGKPIVARRYFPQIEINLAKELVKKEDEEGNIIMVDTGRVIETEEAEFWEMIPEHFNWEGVLEIVAMSFLPTSEAIENAEIRETAEFLLNVPVTDEGGNPTLIDASGKPYIIDKVKVVKDFIESKRKDPNSYVVPAENLQKQGNIETPGVESQITERELEGLDRPEERVRDRSQSKITQLPKT